MHYDFCTGGFLNFSVAADMIGVPVSGYNVLNGYPHLLSLGENLFLISSRVNNCCLFRLFTGNYVTTDNH